MLEASSRLTHHSLFPPGFFGFIILALLLMHMYYIPAGSFSGNPRRVLEDALALRDGKLSGEPHPTLPCRICMGKWTGFLAE